MRRIYILLLAVFTLGGCYEDKGNYDYKDIKDLTIGEFVSFEGTYSVGDRIVVEAPVTPSIDDDLSNYTIKWYIGDYNREEWNGSLTFDWVADMTSIDMVPDIYTVPGLIIEITDNRTGVSYYQDRGLSNTIDINPEFIATNDFFILSDDGGDSKLSYLKYTERESRPDNVTGADIYYPISWSVYNDVYTRQNGEALGSGPIALQEFYRGITPSGQFLILQESGALDIDQNYLRKDIDFSTIFEGGGYPAGVNYLSSGSMMHWLDVVTDQRGQVYTRFKYDENLYHSGAFGKDPIEFEGAVLSNCKVYRNPYGNLRGTLIHDRDNGRLLVLFDGGNGDSFDNNELQNAGLIKTIPETSYPSPYLRSFNDLAGCEILSLIVHATPDWNATVRITMVYLDTATGDYYLQRSDISKSWYGTDLTNIGGSAIKLDLQGTPQKVFVSRHDGSTYVNHAFFAIGNELHFLDIDSGDTAAQLYFKADSKITSIYTNDYRGLYVFIGTEGGFFYDIDTLNAKNKVTSMGVSDEEKLLFKMDGFYNIVDIIKPQRTDHMNFK